MLGEVRASIFLECVKVSNRLFGFLVFWEARQTYKSISFKMLSFGSSVANVIKHSVTNL